MVGYKWSQIPMWHPVPDEAYLKYVDVVTGLSKETCSFVLVHTIEGGTREQPVNKADVTPEMLEEAERA